MDAPDAHHRDFHCLDDLFQHPGCQQGRILLAAGGIQGPHAQIIGTACLGFQGFFQIVGGDADDGFRPQYRTGFFDGIVFLSQMDPVRFQDPGGLHIVVHQEGHLVFPAEFPDFPSFCHQFFQPHVLFP